MHSLSLSCKKITLTTNPNGIIMYAYKIIAFQGPVVTISYCYVGATVLFDANNKFAAFGIFYTIATKVNCQRRCRPSPCLYPIDVKTTQMFHSIVRQKSKTPQKLQKTAFDGTFCYRSRGTACRGRTVANTNFLTHWNYPATLTPCKCVWLASVNH